MRPREIVEQFDEPVRRWFARRVTDPADAEDLAQETMIALLNAFARFRGDSTITTWVYAVARNQLLKYIRGSRRRVLRFADLAEVGCPSRDESDDRAVDRVTVQVIVAHLPLALREVYRLHYCEGRTTAEIASYLRRSQGTVKYQLYEIRRRVRNAMQ